MKQRDIVEHLVSIVPGVQGFFSWVVIHHADVGVLVVEGNVSVLIRGGVGVVGKVDLGPGQVRVSDVQGAADHEGLPCAALGKPRIPALENFQRVRVQPTHLETKKFVHGGHKNVKVSNALTAELSCCCVRQECSHVLFL